ncbi:hypothetical protein HYV11_01410 [Candidatus Dependentiae bacterium]|nr:hypothetical protein [Candidatus Dependentiae bacterium]
MIDYTLLLIILFSLAFIYLTISIWILKKTKTLDSYFLANRNLGVFKLTFTLIGTQLGSGIILGTAQQAYNLGFLGIMYCLGIGLGFILLGLGGIASRMRSLNVATTAEIFDTRYNSPKFKLVASALSIISLWGILVAQIIASKILLHSIGIDNVYILSAFWAFIIFYTMLGGLESIVIIDTLQVFMILGIFGFIFLKFFPLSWKQLSNLKLLGKAQGYYFSKKLFFSDFLPTLLMPMLFSLIEQDLAQRFFAAKTRLTASIAAFLAALILIGFSCVPLFLGMYAKIKKATILMGGSPLLPIIQTIAGPTLFMLAIIAIMSAIASTANSLLSAVSSNIIQDFGQFFTITKHKLAMSRFVSFLVGASALLFAYFIDQNIIFVLENSYRLSVICLLIPTLIAYYHRNLYASTAWTSFFCSIAGFLYAIKYIHEPIWQDLFALSCALAGYIFMHASVLFYIKFFQKT